MNKTIHSPHKFTHSQADTKFKDLITSLELHSTLTMAQFVAQFFYPQKCFKMYWFLPLTAALACTIAIVNEVYKISSSIYSLSSYGLQSPLLPTPFPPNWLKVADVDVMISHVCLFLSYWLCDLSLFTLVQQLSTRLLRYEAHDPNSFHGLLPTFHHSPWFDLLTTPLRYEVHSWTRGLSPTFHHPLTMVWPSSKRLLRCVVHELVVSHQTPSPPSATHHGLAIVKKVAEMCGSWACCLSPNSQPSISHSPWFGHRQKGCWDVWFMSLLSLTKLPALHQPLTMVWPSSKRLLRCVVHELVVSHQTPSPPSPTHHGLAIVKKVAEMCGSWACCLSPNSQPSITHSPWFGHRQKGCWDVWFMSLLSLTKLPALHQPLTMVWPSSKRLLRCVVHELVVSHQTPSPPSATHHGLAIVKKVAEMCGSWACCLSPNSQPSITHSPWFGHRQKGCWDVWFMSLLSLTKLPALHHLLTLVWQLSTRSLRSVVRSSRRYSIFSSMEDMSCLRLAISFWCSSVRSLICSSSRSSLNFSSSSRLRSKLISLCETDCKHTTKYPVHNTLSVGNVIDTLFIRTNKCNASGMWKPVDSLCMIHLTWCLTIFYFF